MAGLILLCLVITSAIAQAPTDPVGDFCRIYGHQTAVIDRKLYIDGGWLYANPIPENPVPTINQGLLYGDLDRLNAGNFPTVHANLSKNSSVPDVAGGILWADQVNKVIWLYGGEYSSAPGTFQLWGYDVVLNQWNLSSAATSASSAIQRVAYGAGTTVNDLGKGYYYGGYLNKLTTPLWSGSPYATNSLIVFDMDGNTLTNRTGPNDGIGRAEGVMVSIPASASGMLVYFGGVTYPYKNSTEVPQSMEYVMLYDIGDEKWYTQKTTGNIPGNRRKFCGGVTWADDKSSYNIYMYGGFGFAENITGFDDLYILTMPTFEWIKWYPEPNATVNPHGLSSCNVIDNSQMIVMGGNFTQHSDCDVKDVFGMHNLNLGQNDATDAKWYQFLPNLTTYIVPPAIISVAGGSPTGGATNLLPPNGWSDPALGVYFQGKAAYQARTPTRSLPAATNAPTAKTSPAKIGAIVGGTVGGLALLIAAVLAVFCCGRRRHNKKDPAGVHASSPTTTRPPELVGSLPHDEKNQPIAHIVGSPSSSHSPAHSPFNTTPLMPPAIAPVYSYNQPVYPPYNSAYQQYYHPQLSPQQQYPPNPMYPYVQYPPGTASPPEGWSPHHIQQHQYQQQQYFPPPDMQRTSPPVQEMPTAMSPSPLAMQQQSGYSEGERVVYYPTPRRDVVRVGSGNGNGSGHVQPSIRRREVGGASSPATGTTVTYSDEGNRF